MAPTEKTEYTTTKATKNARKLSSQIFYFWTFVTEIFWFKVCYFSFFSKIPKSVNFDDFGCQIAGTSLTPRSKSIGGKCSSVRVLQSWFYQFFCRSLRFGAILSDRFDHILIGEKIDIFDENCENGRFCFSHISMKTESPIKVWGSKTFLSDRPRRWVGKQTKKIISKGQILLCKITLFLAIFPIFWPFCHFFGYFWAIFG